VALARLAKEPPAPARPWEARRTWRHAIPLGIVGAAAALVAILVFADPPGDPALPVVVPPAVGAPEESAPPPDETDPPAKVETPVDGLRDLTDEERLTEAEQPEAPSDEPVTPERNDEVPPRVPERELDVAIVGTPTPRTADGGPPGLVFVEGGKTRIGTSVQVVEDLLVMYPQMARPLAGETPRITGDVADFFLMPTEVTMEQYAVYVRATGAKPPWLWGGAAVDEGRREFLDEERRKAEKAKREGRRIERNKFDQEKWWDEHWRECDWEVPESLLTSPAVYVSYADAQRYARWAGLRLMTEFEFARAARRDTANTYPWGDEFDARACNSLHAATGRMAPAGSYPRGSVGGIHDLSGNVWEWTSSPYVKFTGYQSIRVKDGQRTTQAIAPWDSNQRVLVSGSFQQPEVGVRISTRMYAERRQSTDALGFRCAASVTKGLDAAQAVIDHDVRYDLLPPGLAHSARGAVALESWRSESGTRGEGAGAIPGYRVITAYERLAFVPVEAVPAISMRQLADITVESGPVFLGLLTTDRPLLVPALEVGSYHVAYRAAGELDPARVVHDWESARGFHEATGFDATRNQFLFYSLDGVPLVAVPADRLRYNRMREESTVRIDSREPKWRIDEFGTQLPVDTVRFTLAVPGKSGSKGFHFELALGFEVDSLAGWR